ncbi:hypothetical protein LXL04_005424 [Taraxacum kok-saghyz]
MSYSTSVFYRLSVGSGVSPFCFYSDFSIWVCFPSGAFGMQFLWPCKFRRSSEDLPTFNSYRVQGIFHSLQTLNSIVSHEPKSATVLVQSIPHNEDIYQGTKTHSGSPHYRFFTVVREVGYKERSGIFEIPFANLLLLFLLALIVSTPPEFPPPYIRAVQMRTIIGFENGGTYLGHLFYFADYQFSVAGALPRSSRPIDYKHEVDFHIIRLEPKTHLFSEDQLLEGRSRGNVFFGTYNKHNLCKVHWMNISFVMVNAYKVEQQHIQSQEQGQCSTRTTFPLAKTKEKQNRPNTQRNRTSSGGGLDNDSVINMGNLLGCKAEKLPATFLGILIGSNMKMIDKWQPMADKFRKKLSNWKAKTLSIGGRLTIVSNILGGLPNYWLSMFAAPKGWSKSWKK